MKPSPLEFARDFEKLKSDLSRLPAADLRLLLLARFWDRLAPVAGESAYESYLNDYCSLVIGLVQADALSDLTIDSLNRVRRVLNDLVAVSGIDAASTSLLIAALGVSLRIVTLLFYVGAHDEALSLCAKLEGVDDLALPTDSEIRGLSPLDTLRTIYDKYRRDYPELGTLLQGVLAKWEEDALAVEHDRVWCLFVDKDGKGNAATGRMRLLRGTVEQVGQVAHHSHRVAHHSHRVAHHSWWVMQSHPKGRATNDTEAAAKRPGSVGSPDQVAFDNQVKTPDDPFIGVAYDSLKAVRTGLRSAGFAQRAQGSYRAFLSVDGSNRTFTGDSIGLAVSLVAFTQLLKPEVMRQERFIASDIAVTGSIDADGHITPVNNDSIAAKIERAYFSHVRYVVLPEANLATARDTVKRLNKQYPRRRLRLVSAAHLDDVLNDRNIIRSEKVCLGAFITKKAARYSRATKVQVPLLLMLLYALICIIYPKAWVGFDWNPQYVRLTDRGFEALNKDSIPVWDVEYECEGITSASKWEIGDIDKDSANEIAFAPRATRNLPCEANAKVFVYDDDGRELHCLDAIKWGVYPTDSIARPLHVGAQVRFMLHGDCPILITAVNQDMPSRSHVRFWTVYGDSIGWYVHNGTVLLDNDECSEVLDTSIVFIGINNRIGASVVFALPRTGTHGVSPPYKVFDSTLDLTNVLRGNQSWYAALPKSDLCTFLGHPYSSPTALTPMSEGIIKADVTPVTPEDPAICISYSIDMSEGGRVKSVASSDGFTSLRNSIVNSGSGALPTVAWDEYTARLRDSVTYWTDSGWVIEGELRAAEKE